MYSIKPINDYDIDMSRVLKTNASGVKIVGLVVAISINKQTNFIFYILF